MRRLSSDGGARHHRHLANVVGRYDLYLLANDRAPDMYQKPEHVGHRKGANRHPVVRVAGLGIAGKMPWPETCDAIVFLCPLPIAP